MTEVTAAPCRQWDPTKARVMYLHMATWRKANDIENLYETLDFPELDDIISLYPHFYHKVGPPCFDACV